MRSILLGAALAVLVLPAHASAQQRTLEDVEQDYDASVRCAGIYGAAATGKEMQTSPNNPDVATYRGREREFADYTKRFGPQLRLSDDAIEDAVSDVRGSVFRSAREALFAQDEPTFLSELEGIYGLIPDCEAERIRIYRSMGSD
ncbi:hypothetical protein [Brevundimonas sp. TWP2-3-2]|uniref:hypothetical protein n=1 Tax=unclassified Brevundimonas TaxID=2622653 RepID=UPI003CEF97FF